MILLKVLHWDLTQASDSCSPLLWQTQGHDGQQPRQPPHLPRVSWAHTALRHSTGNKTSRSSSALASAVVNENPTQAFRWVRHLHEGQTHKVSRPAGHPVQAPEIEKQQAGVMFPNVCVSSWLHRLHQVWALLWAFIQSGKYEQEKKNIK